MNKQSFYYSIDPQFIKVTKKEFIKYLNSFPRPLKRDVFGAYEPPSVTYNDFELADRYPYSVVASTFLYDDDPNGYYYTPEENRVYRIMINYKEVFDSRSGNKTMD